MSGVINSSNRVATSFIGTISDLQNLSNMVAGDEFTVIRDYKIKCKYIYDGFKWKLSNAINADAFVGDSYIVELGNGSETHYVIKTADKLARLSLSLETEGKTRLRSYVNFTTAADGTAVSVFNRLVGGPNATVSVFKDSNISNFGTQRGDILIPAGQGGTATGGQNRGGEYTWIPPNTELLISILNDSGQVRDLSVSFDLEEFDVF